MRQLGLHHVCQGVSGISKEPYLALHLMPLQRVGLKPQGPCEAEGLCVLDVEGKRDFSFIRKLRAV